MKNKDLKQLKKAWTNFNTSHYFKYLAYIQNLEK